VARKRMLDPSFWTDARIKRLEPIERLFFLGCVSAADDEGRLMADPAFLRSRIFPYDEITTEQIEAVRDRVAEIVPGFVLYSVDGEKYVAFRNWSDYQKPSHAKPSDLPAPLFVPVSSGGDEPRPRDSSDVPPQVRLGKDSVGKDKGTRKRDANLDHKAIIGYKELAHLHVPTALRDDWVACAEEIGTEKLLAFTKEWIGNGWNKQNVNGIMDYARGGRHAKAGRGRSGDEDTAEGEFTAVARERERSGTGPGGGETS